MSNIKKEIKLFNVFQYDEEAAYLREMHKKGWKFVKVSGLGSYTFEECEPEDVIYQLDYNQEGMKEKDEYVQMFEDCGWEYLNDYFGYSYFRKEADEMSEGENGIFCDEESRMDLFKRVFRGRAIPLILLFALTCVNLATQLLSSREYVFGKIVIVLIVVVLIIYLFVFFQFAKKYRQFMKDREV